MVIGGIVATVPNRRGGTVINVLYHGGGLQKVDKRMVLEYTHGLFMT